MTLNDIITKVQAQKFPNGSYVVFGSGPLAAAGIREVNDIDLLVSETLFKTLKSKGWQQIKKGAHDKPLVYDVFEAHASWAFSTYNPTLQELLSTAKVIDGIPFASLDAVKQWKQASGRPKDIIDLALIEKYITQN